MEGLAKVVSEMMMMCALRGGMVVMEELVVDVIGYNDMKEVGLSNERTRRPAVLPNSSRNPSTPESGGSDA